MPGRDSMSAAYESTMPKILDKLADNASLLKRIRWIKTMKPSVGDEVPQKKSEREET